MITEEQTTRDIAQPDYRKPLNTMTSLNDHCLFPRLHGSKYGDDKQMGQGSNTQVRKAKNVAVAKTRNTV